MSTQSRSYTIYSIQGDNAGFVAIPDQYSERLKELVLEYGDFGKVPAAQTVRGIFMERGKEGDFKPAGDDERESDVSVCTITGPADQ
jgi:hypothetical protein